MFVGERLLKWARRIGSVAAGGTWLLVAGNVAGSGSFGADRWTGILGRVYYFDNIIWSQIRARENLLFSDLYFRVPVCTGGFTVSLCIGGVASALRVSFNAAGVYEDTVNLVSVVPGDLINTFLDQTAAGTMTFTAVTYKVVSPTIIVGCIDINSGYGMISGDVALFPIIGRCEWSYVEADAQYMVRTPALISNLRCVCHTSNRTVDSAFRFRINGGFGNQTVTVLANTTGEFEDTTNSDSVVAGNLINFRNTEPAAGGGTHRLCVASIRYSSQVNILGASSVYPAGVAPFQMNSGLTRYITLHGYLVNSANVEAYTQVLGQFSWTARNLFVYVKTNTLNVACTVRLRVNAGDSILTLTIAAGAFGIFEDNVNSVNVVAANLVNYAVTAPAGAGNIIITQIALEQVKP